ncbi:substrate-binding periplasmic protein [Undibacterium terreum]|uniref:Amino acid ABC transporter substrate-binding protein n=1 Tax=Undibacterium terreum TaxID=1224302 RepID=A0A916UBC6_9BURK|nr:transporter substrate-binding domain-containing protein [Undibacterium terreum]GGC66073.1 amino acid ABC transporter substrate-binding protein [Undibacterium terreum]
MRIVKVLGFLCWLRFTLMILPAAHAADLSAASPAAALTSTPMQTQTVSICVDAEPPPWAYWKRDAEGKKTRALVGTSVELVQAAFAMLGKTVEFEGDMPWKRCLMTVESGRIDFSMGGYYDADRARRFDYSIHYNTLTPQVFFRATDALQIDNVADLKKYHGCGVTGASYAHYGLRADDLDLGNGYDSLIRKLNAKRCDYFVEELEVVSAYKMTGIDYLSDPAIRHAPVPGAKAPSKYLMTARNGRASKLLPQFNEALAALIKSGEAAAIWKKHAGNLPYLP